MLEKILEQIFKKNLIKGRWYLGRGRNGNVAYWDGRDFLTISYKFGMETIKQEGYYGKDYGCFQPFLLIDEGKIIEPYGKSAWDKHYGKRLLLKIK